MVWENRTVLWSICELLLLSPLCPAQASPRTTPAEAKPEITFFFAQLKVYKMCFDMFANGFNSPKLFYKPFPLPRAGGCGQIRWALAGKSIYKMVCLLFPGRVWTNAMGLGRGKKVYKMGLPSFPWGGVRKYDGLWEVKTFIKWVYHLFPGRVCANTMGFGRWKCL